MTIRIQDYEPVVGKDVIDELRVLASHLAHTKLQNINSTAVGGGVAEILTRMVPLLQELGVETSWDVITGNQAFFNVTKSLHNALQGAPQNITRDMLDIYIATTEENRQRIQIKGDVVFIHDPQPAGLIALKPRSAAHWVWRCHIDVSAPNPKAWDSLRSYVEHYDAAIFSMPDFAQKLPLPQFMIAPSIDPLSDKNKDLDVNRVQTTLAKYNIDPSRPVITQISRFDRLKDPVGVIAAYRMVKARRDCQLVLAGGTADDDPESAEVLYEVREAAKNDPDIHILLLPPFSDTEINALVRGSTVVLQKSVREGFGLTVTEALWKRKPVIGGAVGGIRTQILDGFTGFLVHSPEGAAHRMLQLLADAALCRYLGENGHLHVKQNFLLTRHVKDYLLVMLALDHRHEDIVYLDT
jgi:trehalose synthase